MLTRIENLPAGAIGFRASGRVTQSDHSDLLKPTIERSLRSQEQVRLLYILEADFAGYEPHALLDNAVFGSTHFSDFERIAFLAADGPYKRAVDAMDGLMPAELQTFAIAEVATAKAWLGA